MNGILIAYATKGGSSRKAAEMLAGCFDDARIADVRTEKADPAGYDAVILGSGIRGGKIYPSLRRWMKRYEKELLVKTKGVFICNAIPSRSETYLKKNYPFRIREFASASDTFGGEFLLSDCSFMERMLIKRRARPLLTQSMQSFRPCLEQDRIRLFAKTVQEQLDTENASDMRRGKEAAY